MNSLEPGAGGADGEYFHAGAASTLFFVLPSEDLVVLFMTQLLQSQRYPFRRELEVAAYQAIID